MHDDSFDQSEKPHQDAVGIRANWKVIAEVDNRTLAEFAMNGLQSYEIPAVLDARPGFLGTAGLKMRSIRTGKMDTFRILVPPEFEEEAAELIKLFLGGGPEGDRKDESIDEDEEA
jgi:hypothetical protein